jgi:hygromycin-B 7''-O-kinase
MLPDIRSRSDYVAIYKDDEAWRPAMEAICTRHRLDISDLHRQALGTHLVYRTGGAIIKLFCPLWPEDYQAEKVSLEIIEGIPVAGLIASGTLRGWPYLIMTALSGQPAVEVWDNLNRYQQSDVIGQLGEIMRLLHQHPPVDSLATDWDAFLEERLSQWEDHHQPSGPWKGWLAQRLNNFREGHFEPVLLNADITADHLLLSESDGRWHISGLLDFGDAMMGHPYYEFIAPLTYFTLGRPQLSRLLLESYGLQVTPERAQRMTTYCFLHRFGRLSDYLDRKSVADGPSFHKALWGNL